MNFLRELGLKDTRAHGQSVKIPYYDESGTELSARLLIALDGHDRYRVKKGDQPGLYGVNKLARARADGDEFSIVMGETDCIALWSEGLSAVGLPTPSRIVFTLIPPV